MRMFLGLVPPPDAIDHLDEFLAVRRDAAPFRWSLPEQFHVTLAFCDDVPDRSYDRLVEGARDAASRRRAVTGAIRGGGAFPDPARAKILHAGLDLTDDARRDLDLLAAGVRAAASRAGVEVDGARFRPHVTVARLGRPTEVSRWVRLLDAYAGPAWTIGEMSLVASYLGEGPGRRPRYEVVESMPLLSQPV